MGVCICKPNLGGSTAQEYFICKPGCFKSQSNYVGRLVKRIFHPALSWKVKLILSPKMYGT